MTKHFWISMTWKRAPVSPMSFFRCRTYEGATRLLLRELRSGAQSGEVWIDDMRLLSLSANAA